MAVGVAEQARLGVGGERAAAAVNAQLLADGPGAAGGDDGGHATAGEAEDGGGGVVGVVEGLGRPAAGPASPVRAAAREAVDLLGQAQQPDQQVDGMIAELQQGPAAGRGAVAPPAELGAPVEQVMGPGEEDRPEPAGVELAAARR